MQHRIENAISFTLFSLIANNRLIKRGWTNDSWGRVKRWPIAGLCGAGISYIFNFFVLRPIYQTDLEGMGLSKYYNLDLNADLIKEDL